MKKILLLACLLLILVSCKKEKKIVPNNGKVSYEIFVASFNDSDGDEIGDLKGVSDKLDYLKDLGVEYLWLMPINKSQTYHKYDIDDYYQIDKSYGSIDDLKTLIKNAKERNIKIILDLVLNHSSSDNMWFKKALENKKNGNCATVKSYCDFYNFSSSFKSGYTKVNDNLYYESVFWEKMPDLNLDSKELRKEIEKIVAFYLKLGIKGFRLDAAYHFYNKDYKKNVEFLNWLKDTCEKYQKDTYLVAEVWASDYEVINYYNSKVDSFFHFGLSDSVGAIAKAINSKNTTSLNNYLDDYYKRLYSVRKNALNAPFLSNHDQGRSGGYFNDIDKTKVAESIYLLLPGQPFIYYGEEVNLRGSGKDENKRSYMPWDEKTKIKNPVNSDYPLDKQVKQTVKQAMNDKNSLWHHIQKLIEFRNEHKMIINARFEKVILNDSLLSYYLESDGKKFLVIHNVDDKSVEVSLKEKYKILENFNYGSILQDDVLKIEKYSSTILERK